MSILKLISTKAGKAVFEHNMIKEGDKIIICFSWVKDSFTLIEVLKDFKKRYPINFELKIIVINPGFDMKFEKKINKILINLDLS